MYIDTVWHKTLVVENIGGLPALHSKIARIKFCWRIKLWWIGCGPPNLPNFVPYSMLLYVL